jgi:primosomal protein N' (replication factor Y)
MSLHFADYRAVERTFQLVTQVSGRAGRDQKEGSVVLQTYSPNHYAYRYAIKSDYIGFYQKEINLREVTKYPPFSTIIRVLVSSQDEEQAQDTLKIIYDTIVEIKKGSDKFIYLACMRSPVKRIQTKFRMQVLARILPNQNMDIMTKIFEVTKKYNTQKCSVFVEINPGNLS